jgi:hypothetical protein
VTPPEPASSECLHPADQRQDFGVTDGQEDWRCSVCGYRSIPELVKP